MLIKLDGISSIYVNMGPQFRKQQNLRPISVPTDTVIEKQMAQSLHIGL